MNSETLDKIYLEWSNFTSATTAKELRLQTENEKLKAQLERAESMLKEFINPCTLSSVAKGYFKEKECSE
jgi:hypothetical protein